MSLLLLKLLLAPSLIGVLGLLARRSGQAAVGRLGGLPIVVGPVLVLLTLEQGEAFGIRAAVGALLAVPAAMAFALTYSRTALKFGVLASLGVALAVWTLVIAAVSTVPLDLSTTLVLALAAVLLGPLLLPREAEAVRPAVGSDRLLLRMLAAGLLSLAVTTFAALVGPDASGMLALFPLATTVLALSSHLEAGAAPVRMVLRNLVASLLAVVAFCVVLVFLLPRGSTAIAVLAAVAAAVLATLLRSLVSYALRPGRA